MENATELKPMTLVMLTVSRRLHHQFAEIKSVKVANHIRVAPVIVILHLRLKYN
jgi:hypothetical protein